MPTNNHRYNTPAKGTENWHTPLNENISRFDTDVEIRDADVNRSDYTPKDGAMFRATDTGAIYRGDGSNWVKLDIEVARANAEALDTERLNDVAAPPPEAGAEAITDVITEPGTKVTLRPGTYHGQVSVDHSNVVIEGAGEGTQPEGAVTIIKAEQDDSPVKFTQGYPEGGLVLRNLMVDGNKANFASGPAIDFGFTSSFHKVQNVKIVDSETHGIYGDGIYDCWFENVQLMRPGVSGKTAHGVFIDYSGNTNSHLVFRDINFNDYDGHSTDAFHVAEGGGVRIMECEEGTNGQNYITVGTKGDVTNLAVVNNYCEMDDASGTFLTLGSGDQQVKNARVVGNWAWGGGEDGVHVVNAKDTTLTNNELRSFDETELRIKSGNDDVIVGTNGVDTTEFDSNVYVTDRVQYTKGGSTWLKDGTDTARFSVVDGGPTLIRDHSGTEQLRIDPGAIDVQSNWIQNIRAVSDDSNSPVNSLYWDSTDGALEYKDPDGTIHEIG